MALAAARQKAFDDWVLSHSQDTIRIANNARLYLRRLGFGRGTAAILDPRRVKKPLAPYLFYLKEQYSSDREFPKNDNGKTSIVAASKILRTEYANLSPEVRKVCCVFFSFL